MDRDTLSEATVVAASRELVCARLLTYESAEEGAFLASLFRGRTGALENTVFALLAPDGKTPLSRAGRSPEMAFGAGPGRELGKEETVARLVEELHAVAAAHPARAATRDEAALLPYHADLRRGLDAAACDMLPLAVVVAKDDAARAALEKAVRPLAWSDALRGKLLWAHASTRAEVAKVAPLTSDAVLVVLQPDAFGVRGKVLAALGAREPAALPAALEATLQAALAKHQPGAKDAVAHIRDGRRQGIHWETEIPVTDPEGPARR